MTEYITKEQAQVAVSRSLQFNGIECPDVYREIDAIPPADVVEVVRCKDCWYYSPLACKPSIGDCRYWLYEERIDSLPVYEDDYCSYGERKDDENAEHR